jgi:hypothetical protein
MIEEQVNGSQPTVILVVDLLYVYADLPPYLP